MRKGNGLASFFPILRVSHWPQLISFFFWKLLSPTDGCVASKCIDMRKQKPPFYTWTKIVPVITWILTKLTGQNIWSIIVLLDWKNRYILSISHGNISHRERTLPTLLPLFLTNAFLFFRSRFNPHKRTSFSDDRDGTRFSSTHRSKVKDFHLHDEINCKHPC